MKYSHYIGVLLVVGFCIVAYMPWIYIPSLQVYVRGMDSGGTIFGKPALMNLFCCALSLLFFLVPKVWAKRANIFSTSVNLAWAFKNFILLNICRGGECPERHAGLYLMMILAIGIFVMGLLPDIKIPINNKE
jgi:hypothetical protein